MRVRWREAMTAALYGSGGFFVAGAGPAGHFRTSAHASPQFTRAVGRLVEAVDAALGRPDPLTVVDIGAGRGELLGALPARVSTAVAGRLRLVAVEMAPRPAGLPSTVEWLGSPPGAVTGVLLATEWLDNVPLDVAEVDGDGIARYVLVDPADGSESPGPPVDDEDRAWLRRWWPVRRPGDRAELGAPRDAAWRAAVAVVERGIALTVDYGHTRAGRPAGGSLTGFRRGRQVEPVPDGSCDITAHVAIDAVAAAAGRAYTLRPQRVALRTLGVSGVRPPLALASTDPAAYVRALSAASAAAELTDPAGLGGHYWLLHPVGVPDPLGDHFGA